uniref:Uncharacterized protein n=1 Tax=Mola mola TaxID=94237 RepID=A0A3Q3WRW4_MOLML
MSRRRPKDKPERANSEDEASKNPDEYQCSGNVDHDFHGLCALLNVKNVPSVKTKLALMLFRVSAGRWKVDEQIVRVLQKMLPSLSKLQSLHCRSFVLADPSCPPSVTLEDNILPEQSYHHLLCEDSTLTHLSLRNNRIGDEGARLIGSALSTAKSANRKLLSLNLAFNSIGDAGAAHIAQGLRLNRALLILSLSNNQIGDSGAARLAAILGDFALTHEEIVVRRKLLLERIHPVSATIIAFEHTLSDTRSLASRSTNQPEAVEITNPLLEPWVRPRNGEIILPGNTTLTSLNLSGQSVTLRNHFSPECDVYTKIMELMALRHPLEINASNETEEGGHGGTEPRGPT